MFERKVILVQLAIFGTLLLVIFGTILLTESGMLINGAIPYVIPTAMVASAVTGWIITGRYQRSKVFRPHIENELSNMGYQLISERPPTFAEILSNLEITPTILFNGTPIQNFTRISQNERMLHVRRSDEVEFELRALITKTWSRKYKLEIVKKTRLN
ncbi:MAG: hypothetical protein AAGA66_09315 [Bacteroidota bacterium]